MISAHRLTTVFATLGVLAGGFAFASAPALAAEQWAVVGTFGGASTVPADPAPLSDPVWLAVNQSTGQASSGNVYVIDKGNDRVEYFSSAGTFEGQFNGSATPAKSFSEPEGIAVDSDPGSPSFGDVYIVDKGHQVVDKFTATGAYLGQLTGMCEKEEVSSSCAESKLLPFGSLEGVAVSETGEVWVSQNEEVGVYSGAVANELILSRTQIKGNREDGTVLLPGGIASSLAIGFERHLFTDGGDYPIDEFDSEWNLIFVDDPGGLSGPLAVELPSNNVFVDTTMEIQEVATPAWSPIESFGGGPLHEGGGVTVDSATGQVYVAEAASNRVFVFEHSATAQAPPPAPTTEASTAISSTTVTLHGELNPKAVADGVGYYFSYNAGAGSSCTGPGSVTTPFDSGGSNVTGNSEVGVSATVKLHPSEEYVFCLIADRFGATAGPQLTFKTGPAAPEVISESASNHSQQGGELNAVINPENEATTYAFEYATAAAAIGTPSASKAEGEAPLPAEFGEPAVTVSAGFLEVTATYYYRVVATNGTGTTYGKVETYTKLPVIASESYSGLTSTGVTLEAEVNPEYQNTTYTFEYATSEAAFEKDEGEVVPGGSGTVPENEEPTPPLPISVEVSLRPGQTYYYRVVLENATTENAGNINAGKPVDGEIHSFTPYAPPAVTTGEAQGITRTTATFSGEVNPEGAETTYYFAYIGEDGYAKAINGDAQEKANPYAEGEATASNVLAGSNQAEAVGPIPVGGLLAGKTYDYALVAINKFAIRTIGPDRTFTAAAESLPIISTGVASGVSQNAATLSGTVSTNGLQTSYGFEIGTEPGNYGPATGLGSIGGAATEEVRLTLSELQPGTTYYYRVTATNADGTVQGQSESFTTPGFPMLISPPASAPLVAAPYIAFPTEEATSTTTTTKKLTNAQQLAKALKACRKDKRKGKRSKCDKQARKRYGHRKG
jgi:hypothetical protein